MPSEYARRSATDKQSCNPTCQTHSNCSTTSFVRLLQVAVLCLLSGMAFSADTLDAKDFDIANYEGRVVYVDFWASWCVPCRASFPFMMKMAEKYPEDLQIIAINVDEDAADAKAFLKEFTTPFTIVMDPEGSLASKYQVPGMPTSYLFSRSGALLGKHIGFRNKDRAAITQWIDEAINP